MHLNFIERAKLNAGMTCEVSTDVLYRICYKYYEPVLVSIYENINSRGELRQSAPYRIHIRTDVPVPELICELEQFGLRCSKGVTCNEWETSIIVEPDAQIAIHPPHMPVKLTHIPEELKTLTPLWYKFLKQTDFLGHLMGTMSNGITVPKQAFGECQTSIVLETYRRAYGLDYKSHQCTECVNYELAFKEAIVAHRFDDFQHLLNEFVTHFVNVHPEAYTMVQTTPYSYQHDPYDGIVWLDNTGRRVQRTNQNRYSEGYL